MASTSLALPPDLLDYVRSMGCREPEILTQLRTETQTMTHGVMQISPEQGAFMRLLILLTGAKHCLEVGTFTGYSALVTAQALPEDGTLICCDVSEEWTSIARRYWREAGVEDKIDLRIRPAEETLDGLIADGRSGTIDFAFIDADKVSYDLYYERCLTLLRPGGLIAVDNVLWDGAVIDLEDTSADTVALRALNAKIADDERVDHCLTTIGDGVTLARKRL